MEATDTHRSLERCDVSAGAGHLPALDGVRGLAILLVMAVHFVYLGGGDPQGPLDTLIVTLSQGGWAGVNLLFLLSGFLITGILFDAKGTPHALRNFYARRALRILPLYYGMLGVYLFLLPPLSTAENLEVARRHQAWLWLYGNNVLVLRGLCDDWLISWSLAIEEHFYLAWPVVVLGCSRRAVMATCGVLVAGAFAFRVALCLGQVTPGTIWVLDPSHLDSFGLGSWIALFLRGPGGLRPLVRPARWLGTLATILLVDVFLVQGSLSQTDYCFQILGWTPLVFLFGAGLVLTLDATPQSPLGVVFRSRPLRFFGRYSYGLYLFQGLFLVPYQQLFPTWSYQRQFGAYLPAILLHAAMATLVSIVVAYASFHLFESPALRLKSYFPSGPRGAEDAIARCNANAHSNGV